MQINSSEGCAAGPTVEYIQGRRARRSVIRQVAAAFRNPMIT